jgi:UDP:flavonoid glycosyltransferase YjiC (YdhE family)
VKRILIATVGSHGDVLPFIALARKFASHGHEPILYTNPFFRPYAEDAAIQFVPIHTIDQYVAVLEQLPDGAPISAFRRIGAEYAASCPEYYLAMKKDVIAGQTVAIGNALLFAHRLLRETDQVPCATIHLAPSVFRSDGQPTRLTPLSDWVDPRTPRWLMRAGWWCIDKLFYDPIFTRRLNRYRAKLGLPRVQRIFQSWIHEADCVVGLFPDWFGQPQADWPANVVLTGFPFYDNGEQQPLPPRLLAFLDAGPPPVVFSAGTATATARRFFETSVEAARQAGARAILLTPFSQQIPAALPENVIHVDYAPFSALLPKVGAFVHHGGIGSTSQALRAGVPQLIRPVAFDQFDNSARVVKLGVARELLVKQYTARATAQVLTEILGNHALRERCRQIAGHFANGIDPMEKTYDAICNRLFQAAAG